MELRDLRDIRRIAVRRFSGATVILGATFFVSAGTIRYWQAWLYMAVILIPMSLVGRYLIRNDPELLARRLGMREERKAQRTIQKLGSIVWLAIFLMPGLNQRSGSWPSPATSSY